jgi:hypothetical protein
MREAPEVRWVQTGPGIATLIGLTAAVTAATVAWVRRARGEERRDRQAMVAAAVGTTAASMALVEVSLRQGWIHGRYFELPKAVQWGFTVPWGVGFYTAWLAGYRWLTENSRHPLAIYGAVTAGLVPFTLLGDQWQIDRGYYQIGNGFRVGYDAAAIVPFMALPLALYEGFKRIGPAVERPEEVWAEACEEGCAPVGV